MSGRFRWILALAFLPMVLMGEPVQEPTGKAADYYRILLKRPRPGYLFDRFLNSWLEQYDLHTLEQFLEESEADEADLLRAFYYESVHELSKASTLYAELIEAHPEWQEVLYYKASVDAVRGFYQDSVTGLSALLEMEPSEGLQLKALKLLGRSQMQLGHKEQGLASWERLLVASGMDIDVAEELLDLQLAEGLYEEALDNCDRLMKEMKDEFRKVQLRMRRATILVRMDRRADAVELLCEAYDLTGQGSWLRRDVLSRIEQLFRGADDVSGLCACYEGMLVKSSEQPALLQAYSEALTANGQEEEALEVARKLMRLVPDDRTMKEWYVQVLIQQGRFDEAIVLVEQFLKRYPKDNELRLQLADLYDMNDEAEKAVSSLRAFLDASALGEADYLQTARLFSRYGFDNEATSILTEMISAMPESTAGREALAMHLSRKGALQLELAMPQYEWLVKTGDLEMVLRLITTLQSVNKAQYAYDLLLLRTEDFERDYRFQWVAFELARALELKDAALEYGMQSLVLAPTARDMQLTASALQSELKEQKLAQTRMEQLQAAETRNVAQIWLLTTLLYSAGDREAAMQTVATALEKNPEEASLLECQFMLASRERNWDEAERVLLALVELQPKSEATWMRKLIPIFQSAGKTEEALEWVAKLKKASPHAIRPYELERDVLLAADRSDEAVEAMRKAMRLFEESKEIKTAMGQLYETTGRLLEAEQLYWRMLNAEESLDARMDVLSHLIRVNQTQGRLDKLIEDLERRAETSKAAAFPLLGLAECYRVNRRDIERQSVLAELLELRPNDVSVLRAQARLEEDLGNYDAARTLMVRIADLDSTGRAYRSLVEYEFLYGDRDAALLSLEDPRLASNPDKVLNMLKSLFSKGCIDPLIEPLAKIVATNPQDYRFAYLYALVLEESGQDEEAFDVLLSLLDLEEEREGVKEKEVVSTDPGQVAQSKLATQLREALRDYLPEELLRFQMYPMYERVAYSYRKTSQNYHYSGMQWMPANLDQLKGYVVTHLGTLGKSLPEDARDEVWSRVDAQLAYAQLLLIEEKNTINNAAWWTAAEQFYPDSEELQMMRLLLGARTIDSEEVLREGVALLGDDHPELVHSILISSLSRYPDLIDLVVEHFDDFLAQDEYIGWALQILHVAFQQMEKGTPASPEMRAMAVRVREVCEQRDTIQAQMRGPAILVALAVEQNSGGFVRAIQKSFYENSAVTYGIFPMNNNRIRHSYSNQGSIPLAFPPVKLLDVQSRYLEAFVSVVGMAPEDLKQEVGSIKDDPLFCLLALAQLGVKDDGLKPYVDALNEKAKKSPDELLTLASWYHTKQPEKSLDYLLQLWELPEAQPHKKLVGETVVSSVGLLDSIPESSRSRLEMIVKEAIARPSNNQSSRAVVVEVMSRLDMPLDEFFLPKSAASAAARRNRSSAQQSNPYNQLVESINKGATEQGLRQLAVMLRREALKAIYLSSSRNYSQSYHHIGNCMNYIKQQSLSDQLIALFEPEEESSDFRQWFEYAYVCDLLGMRSEALAAYRKVAEERPEWRGSSMYLCSLMALDDLEDAQRYMNTLSPGVISSMVAAISKKFNSNSVSLEERISLLGLLSSAEIEMDIQTAMNLRNAFQNQWYYKGKQLPGLFDESEKGVLGTNWEEPKQKTNQLRYLLDENLKEMQQQRRAYYLESCQKMLKESQTASFGFQELTAYIEFTDAPADVNELLNVAESILREGSPNHYYLFNNQRNSTQPLEYYVVELRRQNRLDEAFALQEELVETNPMHKALQQLLALHAAETEADYLEKFTEVFSLNGTTASGRAEAALELHKLDERGYDIDTVVWGTISNRCALGRTHEVRPIVSSMLKECDDAVAFVALIQRLVESMLSASELYTLQNSPAGSINHNNYPALYNKYHQFVSVLQSVTIDVEAFSGVYDFLAEMDGAMQYSSMTDSLINRQANQPLTLEQMEALGFAGPLSGFQFYPTSNNQNSLFKRMVQQLNGDKGKALEAELTELEPRPFGAGLLLVLMETPNQRERPQKVADYLADYSAELAADPDKQDDLFEWLASLEEQTSTTVEGGAEQTPELKQFITQFSEWKIERSSELQEALAKVSIGTLMQNQYPWMSKWRQVTKRLMKENPDEAIAFYFEMNKRFKLASYAQNRQVLDDERTLQQVFQNSQYSAEERMVVSQVVSKLDSESAQKWYQDRYMNQMFNRIASQEQNKGVDYQTSRLNAAKAFLSIIFGSDSPVAWKNLKDALRQVNKKQYPDLVEWLKEQSFPESFSLRMVHLFFECSEEDEVWLRSFFADDENSLKVRLQCYEFLMGRSGSKIESLSQPEVVWPLVDRIEQDQDARVQSPLFTILVKHAVEMEAGEEQLQRAEQLIRLWYASRVDTSRNNMEILYLLTDLAVKVDLEKEALVFLSTEALVNYPQTYAVALRYNFDAFVAEKFPAAVLHMKDRYSSSTVWIPSNAVARCEVLVEAIEEEELQQISRLFFARLPVKTEKKTQTDDAKIEELLTVASETLEQPEMMRWVIQLFYSGKTLKLVEDLNLRYSKQADIVAVLRTNSSREITAYMGYVNGLIASENWTELDALAEQVGKKLERAMVQNSSQQNLLHLMFRAMMLSDDAERAQQGLDLAMKAESTLNYNPPRSQTQVLLKMGILQFDLSYLKLETLSPENRMQALVRFDQEAGRSMRSRLQLRWGMLEKGGMKRDDARIQARNELMDEWVNKAAPADYVSLHATIRDCFAAQNIDTAQRDAAEAYIQSLSADSLIVDQLKAVFSVYRMSQTDRNITDERKADVQRYLERPDLDVVEKVRFLTECKSKIKPDGQPFVQELVDELLEQEALDEKSRRFILKQLPLPVEEPPAEENATLELKAAAKSIERQRLFTYSENFICA